MAPIPNPRAARFADFMKKAVGPRQTTPVPTAQPIVPAAPPIHPTSDHAKRILESVPDHVMSMDSKANGWVIFHSSRDSKELAQRLINFDAPEQVKTDLWNAKKQYSDPVPTPMDRATEALHRMASMDPNVLEIAERSPNILKSLMSSLRQDSEE